MGDVIQAYSQAEQRLEIDRRYFTVALKGLARLNGSQLIKKSPTDR